MPTYDYLCEACGHAFELFQSFKDDPVVECPNCAGPVRRVIAPTPVIFRGSGWYATDSKRPTTGLTSGKSPDSKADTTAATAGDKAAGSSTDDGGGQGGAAAPPATPEA